MVRKRSLLLRSEILGLFVNIIVPNDKHYRHETENLTQVLIMKISQKRKTFCRLFFPFLKSVRDLEHFEKKVESQTFVISRIIHFERRDYLNV